MFDHTTTLDAVHHQRLDKISKVLKDLRNEGDTLTPAHRSKLSLLATMYRMSPTMPDEAKVNLWLHGPDGGKQASLSQGDIKSMSAKVIEDLRGDIEDLKALVASTQTITHQPRRWTLRSTATALSVRLLSSLATTMLTATMLKPSSTRRLNMAASS